MRRFDLRAADRAAVHEPGRPALRDPDDLGLDRPARLFRHADRRAGAQRRLRGGPGVRSGLLHFVAADGRADADRHVPEHQPAAGGGRGLARRAALAAWR